MKNHLTLNIYPNKSFVYNIVKPEDLSNNLEYNKFFRPGRIIYVDGRRVYNGCIKEDCLDKYDEIAEKFYSSHSDLRNRSATIPYR